MVKMHCPKCGNEIVNGTCSCGFVCVLQNNLSSCYQQNLVKPNEQTVFILGILSFFIPILSIIVLIKTKGFNKMNNFGESSKIKIGKRCAIVSLSFVLLCIAAVIVTYGINIGANAIFFENLKKPVVISPIH